MTDWAVAHTHDYLTKDGKPFFYLADTAWMAFANLPLSDWPRYLAYRKLQGFNALQISILPVTHDTSMSPENIDPFLPTHTATGISRRTTKPTFAKPKPWSTWPYAPALHRCSACSGAAMCREPAVHREPGCLGHAVGGRPALRNLCRRALQTV